MFNIEQIFLRYFYLGNSKYAPGTVTSFCIAIIWFFLPDIFLIQSLILIFHIILGFYFCYSFTSLSNEKDPNYPENSNKKTIRGLVKNALKTKPLIFNTVKLIVNSPRDLIRRLSSYSSLINQKTPWIHYLFSSRGFKGFGLNAKMLEIGYRFDGSYKYPNDYG